MSSRAHFWFRIAAVAAITVAQFGPRFWNGTPSASSSGTAARVIAASIP